MPILPAEPDMYPADLWQGGGPASRPGPPWWCLHTLPRQEKRVARALRDRNLVYYLPQVAHESRTPGGRRIRSVLPLFPGYVFFRGDDRDRVEARRGRLLANVLEVWDQATMVRELIQIHHLIESGLPIRPERELAVGTAVRILEGPLKGLVGTVYRKGDRDYFVALVRFLGRGATVQLKDWQIEAIDD